jgi:rhamnopyranosyl-N-acetylglucosaminyl-diphospho-decaprenol beta-1,3/1,4-galactofuranosyltransferase
MSVLPPPPRVVAVIVAYNRRQLLVEALEAVVAQTLPLAAVVVVDNASTDGSADAARAALPTADVVTLVRNTGGAGGFAAGMARALTEHAAEWIWVMDDDTIPTATALEELVRAVRSGPGIALAGSRVVWTDGRDHPMNTPRTRPFVGSAERDAAASSGYVPVRSSSFVSMLVDADAVRRLGLPIADYFIWNDDFEFSTRLLRGARGLFVPQSVVVHKTAKLGSTDVDPGERFYYEVRNKLWLLLHSRGLSPAEKLLYGGATVVRSAKTILRSRNRGLLLRMLAAGLKRGLTGRPQSNARSLAGLGPVTDAVVAIESGAGRG